MRHSDKDIEAAAARFEQLAEEMARNPDAAKVEHLGDLQAVASAADGVRAAQARLTEAVEVSRAHGRSWNELAVALGVSRQAVRQRYGIVTGSSPLRGKKEPSIGQRSAGAATAKTGAVAGKVATKKAGGRKPSDVKQRRQTA